GFVALLAGCFYHSHRWSFLGPVRSILCVAGGAGGAGVLGLTFSPRRQTSNRKLAPTSDWGRWFPCLAIVVLAVGGLNRPWFGVLITVAALLSAIGPRRRRWCPPRALCLTGILLLAILPGGPNTTIDAFHDGQILSGVWEFESGRPLFTEV